VIPQDIFGSIMSISHRQSHLRLAKVFVLDLDWLSLDAYFPLSDNSSPQDNLLFYEGLGLFGSRALHLAPELGDTLANFWRIQSPLKCRCQSIDNGRRGC
jgi:hypothetical protein